MQMPNSIVPMSGGAELTDAETKEVKRSLFGGLIFVCYLFSVIPNTYIHYLPMLYVLLAVTVFLSSVFTTDVSDAVFRRTRNCALQHVYKLKCAGVSIIW